RLPEVLPGGPACLTHGDLWASNVMATADGRPALIDPAVSYTWPEVDLAHVWTTAPPPEADAFFGLYAELTGLDDDWRERLPVVQLRQHLAVVAQFDPDRGCGGRRPRDARALPDLLTDDGRPVSRSAGTAHPRRAGRPTTGT
ncbi:MAG: fructosamine kinase family protein, partial [Cellulosimicrobium funkei]